MLVQISSTYSDHLKLMYSILREQWNPSKFAKLYYLEISELLFLFFFPSSQNADNICEENFVVLH